MTYMTKPIEVEAIQFNGYNWRECIGFPNVIEHDENDDFNETVEITVSRGYDIANVGDYIVKGVNGNFYLCTKQIFESTHEVK